MKKSINSITMMSQPVDIVITMADEPEKNFSFAYNAPCEVIYPVDSIGEVHEGIVGNWIDPIIIKEPSITKEEAAEIIKSQTKTVFYGSTGETVIEPAYPDFVEVVEIIISSQSTMRYYAKRYAKSFPETVKESGLQSFEVKPREGWIELSDGSCMLRDYGKYCSNLLIINNIPSIDLVKMDHRDFNLPSGKLEGVVGDFFKTKKGADAFRVTPAGKDILLRDDWGGAFESYRGGNLETLNHKYFRRARSNGGGSGYDYAVVPKGTKHVVNIDDI